jgi:hypothetical protein
VLTRGVRGLLCPCCPPDPSRPLVWAVMDPKVLQGLAFVPLIMASALGRNPKLPFPTSSEWCGASDLQITLSSEAPPPSGPVTQVQSCSTFPESQNQIDISEEPTDNVKHPSPSSLMRYDATRHPLPSPRHIYRMKYSQFTISFTWQQIVFHWEIFFGSALKLRVHRTCLGELGEPQTQALSLFTPRRDLIHYKVWQVLFYNMA